MRKVLEDKAIKLWYRKRVSPWLWGLLPISCLFKKIVVMRAFFYQRKIKKTVRVTAPVIVVGNITTGGTGKTPLVIALVEHLQKKGWSPGIISRGYGASNRTFPHKVSPGDNPGVYGDEPVMLAKTVQVPVITDPNRPEAARWLLRNTHCDIIISDDGLQHYRLHRDMEIAVIDGQRGLGNGKLLPSGPLREPETRLRQVDLVVSRGTLTQPVGIDAHKMEIVGRSVENLVTGVTLPLSELLRENQKIHAVAGIGNPGPFFEHLKAFHANVVEHRFPDHHIFSDEDFAFKDGVPVVMTMKDAVKCQEFLDERMWVFPVKGELDNSFWHLFDTKLEKCTLIE